MQVLFSQFSESATISKTSQLPHRAEFLQKSGKVEETFVLYS